MILRGPLTRSQMNRKDFQLYLDVAISVLEKKDTTAISSLKNFLCSMPNPKCIEQILTTALLYFAENNQPIFSWLVTNQEALAPELDLLIFTKRLTIARLGNRGWIPGKDFQIAGDGTLLINRTLMISLNDCFSQSELLLIRTILDIDS